MSGGTKRKRRRKPRQPLPPVPDYVRYRGGGRRYWRLGGPLTRDHEAEALAAQRKRPPGRLGRFVLRVLGEKPHRSGRTQRRSGWATKKSHMIWSAEMAMVV